MKNLNSLNEHPIIKGTLTVAGIATLAIGVWTWGDHLHDVAQRSCDPEIVAQTLSNDKLFLEKIAESIINNSSFAKICTGPQGPQGATGPRGEIGFEGVDGEIGKQGERGARGKTGPAGKEGSPGESVSKNEVKGVIRNEIERYFSLPKVVDKGDELSKYLRNQRSFSIDVDESVDVIRGTLSVALRDSVFSGNKQYIVIFNGKKTVAQLAVGDSCKLDGIGLQVSLYVNRHYKNSSRVSFR